MAWRLPTDFLENRPSHDVIKNRDGTPKRGGRPMGRIGPEILGRLFDEHAAALVFSPVSGATAPEDIVQDAFVALARQGSQPDRAVAWLYRVVRNGAIAASRQSRRRRRREQRSAAGNAIRARRIVVRRDRRPDRRRARLLAPRRPGRRDPRGDCRAALGGTDFRGGRPAPGLLAHDRPSTIPGRAIPAASEARIPMDTDTRKPRTRTTT